MSTYVLYNGALYRADELYHYGVKGQKWGVRKYQDESGTLTTAGRKHYSDGGPPQTTGRSDRGGRTQSGSSSSRRHTYETVTVNDFNQSRRNTEASRRRARGHVDKYGHTSFKSASKKVTDKYARIVQRQIENRIVSTALNIAIEGARIAIPVLIAAL